MIIIRVNGINWFHCEFTFHRRLSNAFPPQKVDCNSDYTGDNNYTPGSTPDAPPNKEIYQPVEMFWISWLIKWFERTLQPIQRANGSASKVFVVPKFLILKCGNQICLKPEEAIPLRSASHTNQEAGLQTTMDVNEKPPTIKYRRESLSGNSLSDNSLSIEQPAKQELSRSTKFYLFGLTSIIYLIYVSYPEKLLRSFVMNCLISSITESRGNLFY